MSNTTEAYFGNDQYVTFDEERAREFIQLYKETKELGLPSFDFEDIDVDMSYAYHIIEFLTDKLKLDK